MCMSMDRIQTKTLRTEIKAAGGTVIAYKAYNFAVVKDALGNNVEGVKLVPPYRKTEVKIGKDGTIRSNRRTEALTVAEKKYDEIEKGIHVYMDRRAAVSLAGVDGIVVEVEVTAADLVACNYDRSHAVFTKVRIKDRSAVLAQISKRIPNKSQNDAAKEKGLLDQYRSNINIYKQNIEHYENLIKTSEDRLVALAEKAVPPAVLKLV
jgi:hypothetical protein